MLIKFKRDIDNSLAQFIRDTRKNYKLHYVSNTLFQGIQDFLVRDGKRIRPILYLVSYLGYSSKKKINYTKLLRSSLALELFHDFMLIHDDVIDKSALRRGKPTLHRVFNSKMNLPKNNLLGESLSIVAGDVVFALAIDSFLEIDEDLRRKQAALKKLVETAAYTGAGEFLDVTNAFVRIEDIKKSDVFINYTYKTAKYTFECPLLIGAILSGMPKGELDKLSRLGINLGLAFQIQDDMLDIFSSSKAIGKPVLSDLIESKKTLLVWRAYNMADKADKARIKFILEKKNKTYEDLMNFRELIRKTKAHTYCIEKTFNIIKEANQICSKLEIRDKYRIFISDFIHGLFTKTEKFQETIL